MDYGFRKKRRLSREMKITLAAGAAVSLAIAGYFTIASVLRDRDKNIADSRAYAASGAPCPTTTKAQLAANGPNLRHGFDFGDMHLVHAFGDADCAWIADHAGAGMGRFPVCRFTSPGSLEVVVGKTDVLFAPGLGRPAAIVLDRGQVRCLLTAKEMG
ncbi:MAG: hypothetical protein JWO72_1125 [Caulobacteraceae bacterium]|nr:hypothetical protein [Caulobacteraceae bacterium]